MNLRFWTWFRKPKSKEPIDVLLNRFYEEREFYRAYDEAIRKENDFMLKLRHYREEKERNPK